MKLIKFFLIGLSLSACKIEIAKEGQQLEMLDSLLSSSAKNINAGNYDSAKLILQSGITLAEGIGDTLKLAGLFYNKGYIMLYTGTLDSAQLFFNKSKLMYKSLRDQNMVAQLDKLSGLIYRKKGSHQLAIKNYLSALDFAIISNDTGLAADVHNSLGLLYHELHEHAIGVKHFVRSMNYYLDLQNVELQGNVLNNIGLSYHALQKYFSADSSYRKSLKLKIQTGDSSRLTTTLLNLGELYIDAQQYDSASTFLRQSLIVQRKFPNERLEIAIYHLFGELYRRTNQFDSSKIYLKKANTLLEGIESRRHLMDHFEYQKKMYQSIGNYQRAIYWDAKYDSMNRVYFEEERLKTQEVESDFYLDKEKTKNRELEGERRRQEELAYALSILLFTISGFSLIFFRHRRKLRMLNVELISQNKKIETLNRQNFHFTKNSLAELVSMLNVQTKKLEDGEVKNTLISERLRLETINLLYRQLFTSAEDGGSDGVNMYQFLTKIIENTTESMLPIDVDIKLSFDIDSISLPNEMALNFGIIVNEICINACKYAFGETEGENEMKAELHEKEDCFELILADTGTGFSKEVDWKHTKSFGLSLIRLLSNDIQAELEVSSTKDGLSYHFRIPKPY